MRKNIFLSKYGRIKTIVKPITIFLKEGFIWIASIIGLLFIITSFLQWEKVIINDFFRTIGIAIFTGGIFSFLLKSFLLLDIFKKELSNIIYAEEFLSKRNDINEVWRKISRILYKNKFPEICKKFEEDILEKYFPINVDYYYDSWFQEICIKKIDEEYIELIEITNFIIKSKNKNIIKQHYKTKINLTTNNSRTSCELISLKINEKNIFSKEEKQGFENFEFKGLDIDKNKKELIAKYRLNLSGYSEYKVFRKMKKIYSLKENTKGFNVTKLTHNFTLNVRYFEGLKIDFFPAGCLREFKEHDTTGDHEFKRVYDGILFPKQGYRLFFKI